MESLAIADGRTDQSVHTMKDHVDDRKIIFMDHRQDKA